MPSRPVVVFADPDRLATMLARLLESAARAAEPGSQMRLSLRCEGDAARLQVRDVVIDNGRMPTGTALDLNEPDTLSSLPSGVSAVGLALVSALSRRLGGNVSVSGGSGPGRGVELRPAPPPRLPGRGPGTGPAAGARDAGRPATAHGTGRRR